MKKSLISWLALGLFAACSSEEPGPRADDKLKNESGFCRAWAEAACSEETVLNCDSTRSACLEQQASYCANLIPDGYESLNAQGCIDAVEKAYRDAVLTAEELRVVQRLEGECSQLIDGGDDAGEDCTLTVECDTVHGYVCVVKPGAEAGTCQVPNTVGGGDACSDLDVICDAGYYCRDNEFCVRLGFTPNDPSDDVECNDDTDCDDEETCVSDVCVPRCTFNEICGAEGRCEIPPEATEGYCAPLLPKDGACSTDEQCLSGYCQVTAAIPSCRDRVVLTAESSLCSNL